VSKGRRRGSKQRRSKLSTETLSEESSGDEDDSLTVGSNSDEENDQLNLMPLTFQTSPHTAHPLTQTEGEEETEEAEEDEEESRYGKYN
jgi:dethiobiotin synthetase